MINFTSNEFNSGHSKTLLIIYYYKYNFVTNLYKYSFKQRTRQLSCCKYANLAKKEGKNPSKAETASFVVQ